MSRWPPRHATSFAGTLCALSIIRHVVYPSGEPGQMKVRRGPAIASPRRSYRGLVRP
jgi:hypothetical protein